MLSPEMIDEIRRLLVEGQLSQRKIARRLRVSRATVSAIARGRRPDFPPRQPRDASDEPHPHGPPRRCPGCGGLVYLPCRLCRVRAIKRQEHQRAQQRRMFAKGDSPPLRYPGQR